MRRRKNKMSAEKQVLDNNTEQSLDAATPILQVQTPAGILSIYKIKTEPLSENAEKNNEQSVEQDFVYPDCQELLEDPISEREEDFMECVDVEEKSQFSDHSSKQEHINNASSKYWDGTEHAEAFKRKLNDEGVTSSSLYTSRELKKQILNEIKSRKQEVFCAGIYESQESQKSSLKGVELAQSKNRVASMQKRRSRKKSLQPNCIKFMENKDQQKAQKQQTTRSDESILPVHNCLPSPPKDIEDDFTKIMYEYTYLEHKKILDKALENLQIDQNLTHKVDGDQMRDLFKMKQGIEVEERLLFPDIFPKVDQSNNLSDSPDEQTILNRTDEKEIEIPACAIEKKTHTNNTSCPNCTTKSTRLPYQEYLDSDKQPKGVTERKSRKKLLRQTSYKHRGPIAADFIQWPGKRRQLEDDKQEIKDRYMENLYTWDIGIDRSQQTPLLPAHNNILRQSGQPQPLLNHDYLVLQNSLQKPIREIDPKLLQDPDLLQQEVNKKMSNLLKIRKILLERPDIFEQPTVVNKDYEDQTELILNVRIEKLRLNDIG